MLDLPDLLPALKGEALPVDPGALLPPPEALVDAFLGARPGPGLEALLGQLGCPGIELLSSPAAARAGLLAARIGRAFTHHELRVRIPMPEELHPEIAVWQAGTVPTWSDGVLAEPKYFSFFQDDPHSPFNPNHRAKWRSHELLHGVVGWYWHPEMTRFEACLGARLGELLPVLHWYGLDEIGRARCPRHALASPTREGCLDCERASLRVFAGQEREAGLRSARWSEAHLAREWAACLEMLESGRPVSTPVPGIDAQSDAEGYLLGHWNRLTAWSFGAWVERFCRPGVDYSDSMVGMALRVARTTHSLCSGPLTADPGQMRRLRARRAVQDLGYRLLLVLEHAGEGPIEDRLLPEIDVLAQVAAGLLTEGEESRAAQAIQTALGALDEVAALLPDRLSSAVGAMGMRFLLREAQIDAGLDQLLEGLADALPDTWESMTEPEEVGWRFAASDHFDRSGTLAARFAAWWAEEGGADADLVALEALVQDLPRRDEEAELYAVVPEAPPPAGQGVNRLNRTLRRAWLDEDVLEAEDIEDNDRFDEEGRVEVAVVWLAGTPRILVLDEALAQALEDVEAGREAELEPWLRLVESGHVVAWPSPRRAL